jgi:hypothetical protein
MSLLLLFKAAAAAPQLARPDADITDGAWLNEVGSATNLFASIDETSASDADYITNSTGTNAGFIGLSNITDPAVSTGHIMRWRAKNDLSAAITLRLKVGGTNIATQAPSITSSFANYSYTLSGAEADNITDYNDLRIEFMSGVSGVSQVSWFEFEVPAATSVTTPLAVAGTITPGGVLQKQDNKPLSGSLTPAGVLQKQARKVPVGVITPAGALRKQDNKIFAGALTPGGSVQKNVQKSLLGSLTPAGVATFLKVAVLAVGGTISPAGALTKLTVKGVSGILTPAGSLVKTVTKTLLGSITPAGVVTLIRVVVLAVSGAIAPAGALVKSVSKTLAGSITPAGTIVKNSMKTLVGVLTPAGTLSKSVVKSFAGTLAPSGLLTPVLQVVVGVWGKAKSAAQHLWSGSDVKQSGGSAKSGRQSGGKAQ